MYSLTFSKTRAMICQPLRTDHSSRAHSIKAFRVSIMTLSLQPFPDTTKSGRFPTNLGNFPIYLGPSSQTKVATPAPQFENRKLQHVHVIVRTDT